MARRAEIKRDTAETRIVLKVDLDGQGIADLKLPLGFLSHMLTLFSKHSLVDLTLQADGDLDVDDHHLTEDVGIALGQAIGAALEDKRGIRRYGETLLPMDEVLVQCALDLSGRFHYESDYRPGRDKVGDLSTELVDHFFRSLAAECRMNLHFLVRRPGANEHHRVEALFKSFARALRMAIERDARIGEAVPSSKGLL